MPNIRFTVTSKAPVVVLYHRESGGPVRIELTDGVGEKDTPANTTPIVYLFLHGTSATTANLKIEQPGRNVVHFDQEVVANAEGNTPDVSFYVLDEGCR